MITFGGQGGNGFGGGVMGGGSFYDLGAMFPIDPGTYSKAVAGSSPLPTPPGETSGWGDFFRFAGAAAVTAAFTKYLSRDDGKTQLPRGAVSPVVVGSSAEKILPGFSFPSILGGGGAGASSSGANPLLLVALVAGVVLLVVLLRKRG
jgi:hypothetical protein